MDVFFSIDRLVELSPLTGFDDSFLALDEAVLVCLENILSI